jgi:tRNA (cytidine56-2'-O)-methyltransferase
VGTGSNGSNPRRRPERPPEVAILRVGHRPGRDPRLSTHLALAARALGARTMYLEPPDPALAERVRSVATRWGGEFEVIPAENWRSVIRAFDGPVVHLTMYGRPFEEIEHRLADSPRVLLVVGGAKVPSDLYRLATYNVAVGHQPHSEVAAVAVVLARLRGIPGPAGWPGARQRIVPRARGKKVVTSRRRR